MAFARSVGIRFVVGLLVVGAVACGSDGSSRGAAERGTAATSAVPAAQTTGGRETAGNRAVPRIVVLGDSLTAGLGLSIEEAYPALLQQRVTASGLPYQVINAGVSGDTSAGGLARLDWALDGDVRILILALGANDGLRGLPTDQLKSNLSAMIEKAQNRGIAVILAGMEAPPNWGVPYTKAFHEVYQSLARTYRVPLVPFLLAGVAGIERLNQRDGIHPTAEGDRIVADSVWAVLQPVAEQRARRTEGAHGP